MKSIHLLFVFLMLFFINAFATPDCSKAPAIKIELYPEEHDTAAADRIWRQLFIEAATGQSRVFFEAIPRSANSNTQERDLYIQQFVDVGYRSARAGSANIFGMDSNELKFISIASGMYVLNAFDGVMRDPVYLDLVIASLELDGVKEALMRSPEFSGVYGDFLKLAPEIFAETLVRSFQEVPDSFRRFLLSAIDTMIKDMESQGHTLFKPNLEAFAVTGDPLKNDEQLITYSIGDRNQYMVDSVLEVICNSSATQPVKLSIGFRHATGMERLLKEALPKSEVVTIPMGSK